MPLSQDGRLHRQLALGNPSSSHPALSAPGSNLWVQPHENLAMSPTCLLPFCSCLDTVPVVHAGSLRRVIPVTQYRCLLSWLCAKTWVWLQVLQGCGSDLGAVGFEPTMADPETSGWLGQASGRSAEDGGNGCQGRVLQLCWL